MKIKLRVKCYKCNKEHTFEIDTTIPYCYIMDTEAKMALIDIQVVGASNTEVGR